MGEMTYSGEGCGRLGKALRALPDETLARMVAAGNDDAFAAIYARYLPRLERYCRTLLRDAEESRDVAQDAMLSAYRALPGASRDMTLRPWLYRIAHNAAVDVLRRRRDAVSVDLVVDEIAVTAVEETADVRDRLRELVGDLRRLPTQQRGALVMRELDGLGYTDIGDVLGVSPSAARRAVADGRAALVDFREARSASCDVVMSRISSDGRTAHGRVIRAHLTGCTDCRDAARRPRDAAARPAGALPARPRAGPARPARGGRGRRRRRHRRGAHARHRAQREARRGRRGHRRGRRRRQRAGVRALRAARAEGRGPRRHAATGARRPAEHPRDRHPAGQLLARARIRRPGAAPGEGAHATPRGRQAADGREGPAGARRRASALRAASAGGHRRAQRPADHAIEPPDRPQGGGRDRQPDRPQGDRLRHADRREGQRRRAEARRVDPRRQALEGGRRRTPPPPTFVQHGRAHGAPVVVVWPGRRGAEAHHHWTFPGDLRQPSRVPARRSCGTVKYGLRASESAGAKCHKPPHSGRGRSWWKAVDPAQGSAEPADRRMRSSPNGGPP
ncbi:sigma-70 family RNA polymerase sigma factor [Conexibacter sp. W3-3-2]|nr:sigma-70 family RNA polymerase sigma factor [Conexibacter sp. W3-3-2]